MAAAPCSIRYANFLTKIHFFSRCRENTNYCKHELPFLRPWTLHRLPQRRGWSGSGPEQPLRI